MTCVKTILAVTLVLATQFTFAADVTGSRTVEIKVTENGFEPREVRIGKDRPTTLLFRRITDNTCITAIDIPAEQSERGPWDECLACPGALSR